MTRITLSLLLFVTLAAPAFAAGEKQTITLRLPESILADTINQSVPFKLNTSEAMGGSVAIQKIDNLKLGNQSLSALLGLVGKDVQIKTAIAGHEIRLNIGNVLLDFAISANIRFDEKTQTLFIKPVVNTIESHGNQKSGEIGNLLIALFNDKEFPLAINKLQPIITDTGSKKLAISMHIENVTIDREALVLHILPAVKTLAKPKP